MQLVALPLLLVSGSVSSALESTCAHISLFAAWLALSVEYQGLILLSAAATASVQLYHQIYHTWCLTDMNDVLLFPVAGASAAQRS
jgi:hypothetical protein